MALEILKIIHRKPRVSPVLIHDQLKKSTTMPHLQQILRSLKETGQIDTISRGVYIITEKGVETLRSSENNQTPASTARIEK